MDTAEPWSLSGRYGLGEFPWHTDGAISKKPPRYMALLAIECQVGGALTQIFDTRNSDTGIDSVADKLQSVVLRGRDKTGRRRTLRARETIDGEMLVRWDPRCLEADDRHHKEIDRSIATNTVESINWRPGTLAIIDNWRMLHRRTAVSPSENRRIWRAYASKDA
ncbi:TauD/TfdA family dioxygenase [Amycolatopsis japonica]|uniref:TauD/TfdA family dioxygenase n=1 Tax=Amycolatopsis japonica TaxID=208439 RepID=UPI0033FFBFCA